MSIKGFDPKWRDLPDTIFGVTRERWEQRQIHTASLLLRRLQWLDAQTTLAPGDVCALPSGLEHALALSMSGEVSLFRVRNTDDKAGPTQWSGNRKLT